MLPRWAGPDRPPTRRAGTPKRQERRSLTSARRSHRQLEPRGETMKIAAVMRTPRRTATWVAASALAAVLVAAASAAGTGGITESPIPTATSQPVSIVTGPDGALWFTEQAANNIGRIT